MPDPTDALPDQCDRSLKALPIALPTALTTNTTTTILKLVDRSFMDVSSLNTFTAPEWIFIICIYILSRKTYAINEVFYFIWDSAVSMRSRRLYPGTTVRLI